MFTTFSGTKPAEIRFCKYRIKVKTKVTTRAALLAGFF